MENIDNVECEEPQSPTNCDEISEADQTIHAFNLSNITVIEKSPSSHRMKATPYEGSDSGVEVLENVEYQRALSSNSAQSCDSSIISCCSNYEEAYNLLVRRNSTLLEDYTLRNVDGNSENGSESSSLTRSSSSRNSKRSTKKKVNLEIKTKEQRSRSKPPLTPKTPPARLKSIDRLQGKTLTRNNSTRTTPNSLELKKDRRASSSTRTPQVTPTDDGRWPSVNSKPAPLLARSLRGILEPTKITKNETKTIEKYATLPRRRKDDEKKIQENVNRLSIPKKVIPPKLNIKRRQRIKIYHETSNQTALTMADLDKAFAGLTITQINPDAKEKIDMDIQCDIETKQIETLQHQLKVMMEKYEKLNVDFKDKSRRLLEVEDSLKQERMEKEGLQEELKVNSQRVLAILGDANLNDEEKSSSDSLMMLESRFQNVSQIVIRQEEEISKLNAFCRTLQIDLEKSLASQKFLVQQQQELEAETVELQEFMQAEKNTLTDSFKDAENEIAKLKDLVKTKNNLLHESQEECKRFQALADQRWQENLGPQIKLGALESKSRELLVYQGSSVSSASVALSALIGRLEGLVDELVTSYNISEQELEDVIYHNEAYSNSSSSPDATPERMKLFNDRFSPPKKGSSLVSAVITAIKNAAAQTPFSGSKDYSKDNLCTENSSSNEMLDSETEPCLMMEHVLEDVIIPDGHSHNMISSFRSMRNSLSESTCSIKDFKQMSTSLTGDISKSICDIYPSSLVDQVIDVDNIVTKLLKIIRIILLENDEVMNELQQQQSDLNDQVCKQKETNKVVVKQLKDWEILGARLKTEVKELMQQLSRKNNEIDNFKQEINNQREQVEKLNQDVCELSTALSKAELEAKIKEEEIQQAVKNWKQSGETLNPDVLGRLITSQNEIPTLKDKLEEMKRHMNTLSEELRTSRQVLTVAVNEAKKQYEAIDNALDVLHKNQTVVQQCQPLIDLQRHLETVNFQSASAMPLVVPPADCNANAALLQAIAQIAAPAINTTA